MKKKIVALVLASAMMVSAFAGCGNGAAVSSAAEGTGSKAPASQSLSVSLGAEPATMDPALNQAADVTTVMNHLFEGLTRYSSDHKIINAQAKEIKKSDDHKTYTITLRDDIKWSDGKPVTAGDFEYAWKRVVDPKTASQYVYIFDPVLNANEIAAGKMDKDKLGVKATDDKTLVVTLRAPCAYFDELLSFTAYFPVRKDIVEGNDNWTQDPKTYISNGAFKLKDWSHKESITVEKNPNYYDKDKIKLDTLKFVLLEDDSPRLAAYQNDEISFCYTIPVEEIATWQDKPDFKILPDLSTNYCIFNCEKKPFDDVRVRKAFSLAIDRNYIAEKVTKKAQAPAGAFVPTGLQDEDSSKGFRDVGGDYISIKSEDYEKNVAEAKKLLAEAGYPDGKGFPSVEYVTNPASMNNALAEALQNMWKTELGINVTISQQEWSVFLDTRNKANFQIARGGFGVDFNDAVSMLDLFVTNGGNNSGKYSNPEYDKLIEQIKATDDNKVRMPLLHQAEDILMRDMVVAPTTYRTRIVLLNPKVKGYYQSPMGFDYFMYASVEG
ncbi:peptide ABC transporter substrate-binding protein [Clostridium sp. KNHs216]|uniref:peptide ABC transporter substrate-binding protein n=1 Tax=Clostridium sp. KNHs216 TaxID=1550235 RepID=UPI00114FD7A1|nr:peptide ABC transporter substrate-binding protein [Clostridium sp. KNHs216]TQI68664.1 oligopeptide transport system substrate-binding protein [Clostridium sp. KNHs216]